MNSSASTSASNARAYFSNDKKHLFSEKKYKGRNPHLKCKHCDATGHVKDHCWILHPELKPDFMKNERFSQKKPQYPSYKANHALSLSTRGSEELHNFTSNPTTLINEFAAYLQMKKEVSGSDEAAISGNGNSTALLGKFAGFLADSKKLTQDNMQGILTAFNTALNISQLHELWIIDSGATDHMTNQSYKLHDFKNLPTPSFVSVANGEGAKVLGMGKIHLVSDNIKSKALYVLSFHFQLLSVGKITHALNSLLFFLLTLSFFRTASPRRRLVKVFSLDGLYYLSKETSSSQGISSQN